MASLKEVLTQNVELPPLSDKLGGGEKAAPPTVKVNKAGLKRGLVQVKKDNNRYFLICVAMVLILFAVSVGVVIFKNDQPDLIKAIMAALGVSSAGLITMMIKLWRDKSNVELVLVLATNMDDEALKTVLAVLVKKI